MTTVEDRAALKAHVRAAFTGGTCPPAERIALHECAECDELRAAFAGIEWETMPDALIESHELSLPLLSPEAFAYFLPAYMLYALDHLSWQYPASEHTVYAAGPAEPVDDERGDWYRERFKALSPRQAKVVEEFLALVANDPEFGDYLGDVPERREQFRALWDSRWAS